MKLSFARVSLTGASRPSGAEIRTAADVAPETLTNLGLLFGPGVAVFGFTAVWLYTRYQLNREQHAEILRQLRVRRAELEAT